MTIEPIRDAARNAGPTENSVRQIQDFTCPVCRAKQVAQPECRRCNADLSLYLKALRSVNESCRQIELAIINGNSQIAEKTICYLKWLSPSKPIESEAPEAPEGLRLRC